MGCECRTLLLLPRSRPRPFAAHRPAQTDNPETWEPFTVAFNGETHGYSDVAVDGPRLEFVQRDLHGAELDKMVLTKSKSL